MATDHHGLTDRFKIVFEKLPKGVQRFSAWTIAIGYLFGLPCAFAWSTGTGVPGFFFAFFALLFIGQAWSIYLGIRSKFWPTTEGMVLSSRVARYADSEDSSFWYDPKVRYRYTVADLDYKNDNLSFKQSYHTPDKAFAESIAAKYPPSGTVTVYYKPNRPSHSTLETGLGDGWPWLLLVLFY